jgi:hypothetical protein
MLNSITLQVRCVIQNVYSAIKKTENINSLLALRDRKLYHLYK